jgi:hypothetical protein
VWALDGGMGVRERWGGGVLGFIMGVDLFEVDLWPGVVNFFGCLQTQK